MNHTTFSWKKISGLSRSDDSPITELIEYVIRSGMCEFLYPATMHNNLRIGRSKNFARADGELTVEHYEQENGTVRFSYYDSDNTEPWSKECGSKDVIETFEHIVTKRLRWCKIDNK